jgi:hypothetical protein
MAETDYTNVKKNLISNLKLISIAAVAFITACIAHEVVGHGGACLIVGKRIQLLTSVYFRCEDSGSFVDMAGPFANLMAGLFCFIALKNLNLSVERRYFITLTMAFNLFWLSGCLVEPMLSKHSDFAYFLANMQIHPGWLGALTFGLIGVISYWLTIKAIFKNLLSRKLLHLSYFTAGTVSCLAALCYHGPIMPAFKEAAMESFISMFFLLFIAKSASARNIKEFPSQAQSIAYKWILVGALGTTGFALTLGKGFVQ